mmetsp:Transcript_58990/g.128081  ORF Transcript_58990/g.128081 Transcript_58990/m.128081 type:complete len:358 (-) Transcript_58990:114-1187(-)
MQSSRIVILPTKSTIYLCFILLCCSMGSFSVSQAHVLRMGSNLVMQKHLVLARSVKPQAVFATRQLRGASNEPAPHKQEAHRRCAAILKMLRLNALPMGAGLVALGAYGARSIAVPGATPQLLLAAALTVIVTGTSMVINDYHDFKRGVDTHATKPGRPLVKGDISLAEVKAFLIWVYSLHLGLLCLLSSKATRLWVLSSTMITYLYSQYLKPVPALKNIICALTVSMALGLGAMSVSAGLSGLASVWRPMVVVGGAICHREILMDILDAEGDAITGVKTLPVVLGVARALALSFVPLGLAGTVAASSGAALAFLPLALLGMMSLLAARKGFDPILLNIAIESAPFLLLTSLLYLLI